MQNIKREEIERIAVLCSLEVSGEEMQVLLSQVTKILEHVSMLSEVDIKDVPPTSWTLGVSQRMQEDKPERFENPDAILDCTTERRDRFFVVPKVVEKE
jgi:aspartyl/glutamyl-tRNA(Asn/Gln) amidotransferase C subunit